jgi:hypothetical protein
MCRLRWDKEENKRYCNSEIYVVQKKHDGMTDPSNEKNKIRNE